MTDPFPLEEKNVERRIIGRTLLRENMSMAITPYLLYEDVGAALEFLSKAFGFRKFGETFAGPDGKLNHAAMKFGEHAIMMGCPGAGFRNPRHLGHATQMLYIDTDNVDKRFERARKAGATVIEEPADTFYGARRFGVADPEGHQWYFAQPSKKPKAKKTTAKKSPKKAAKRSTRS